MSISGELASEIWAEAGFHADLAQLETANIRAELRQGELIGQEASFDWDAVRRLLQTALIFAETEDDRYQGVAQRISTATLRSA